MKYSRKLLSLLPVSIHNTSESDYDSISKAYRFLIAFFSPIIGHTYDKKAIESWLDQKKIDPFTNKTLKKEDMKPNYAIRQAVEEYKKMQSLNNTWWNAS